MRPVIALSDLHGSLLTLQVLKKMRAKYPQAPVVFGGDYQDSFHHHTGVRVAQRIQAIQLAEPEKVFVLKGNHDAALVESMTGRNSYWLDGNGEDVILEAVADADPQPASMAEAIEMFKDQYADLIRWLDGLPLHFQIGKLCFVHAGLDLSLQDPIASTPEKDQYWVRESYWYGEKNPYWGHNPLDLAIITGHTPTNTITGVYDDTAAKSTLRNRTAGPSGILTIQYEGEMARFFIDGGLHGGPAWSLGNIGVFDADTGTLIDAFEDDGQPR